MRRFVRLGAPLLGFLSLFLYICISIMASKKHVDIEIDKLTNSIENVITGEVFETEFNRVSSK